MSTQVPGRFWVIRYPEAQGAIVAKFESNPSDVVPDAISEYDGFTIQSVPDRARLVSEPVDWSGLSAAEMDRLTAKYPDMR